MTSLNKINSSCAAIDIGSEEIFVAIEEHEVKSFGTFTDDYLKVITYMKEHNIISVAMEATGVYWIPLFEMLEASGIEVCLVNGRDVKNVPAVKATLRILSGYNNFTHTDFYVHVLFPMMLFDSYALMFACVTTTFQWLLNIFSICKKRWI